MAESKKRFEIFHASPSVRSGYHAGHRRIRDEDGNIVPLEIRVLTQEEINRINDNYRHRSIATDKKGNPLIANGEVVWKTERDSMRAARHMIAEALVYPNLKEKELMDFYHCVDITEMPLKVFPNPNEYQQVFRAVMHVLGLSNDVSDDEDLEAAKN